MLRPTTWPVAGCADPGALELLADGDELWKDVGKAGLSIAKLHGDLLQCRALDRHRLHAGLALALAGPRDLGAHGGLATAKVGVGPLERADAVLGRKALFLDRAKSGDLFGQQALLLLERSDLLRIAALLFAQLT